MSDDFASSQAPLTWPYLALGGDGGSGSIAGWHFLGRWLRCDADFYEDRSHGGYRELEAAWNKNTGSFLHQALLCSVWNFGVGPWSETARCVVVKNSMLGRFNEMGLEDAVLDELIDDLVADYELGDLRGSSDARKLAAKEVHDSKSWWQNGVDNGLAAVSRPLVSQRKRIALVEHGHCTSALRPGSR